MAAWINHKTQKKCDAKLSTREKYWLKFCHFHFASTAELFACISPAHCRSRRVNGKRKRIIPHFFSLSLCLCEFIEKGFLLHSFCFSPNGIGKSQFSSQNNFPPTPHYTLRVLANDAKLWIFLSLLFFLRFLPYANTHALLIFISSYSLRLQLRPRPFVECLFPFGKMDFE